MISDKQIKKFQKLYLKEFGIKLPKEEALIKGVKLIRLVELICRPKKNSKISIK